MGAKLRRAMRGYVFPIGQFCGRIWRRQGRKSQKKSPITFVLKTRLRILAIGSLWAYLGKGRLMECPFCKLDVPVGATVCGHCGAYEESKRKFGATPLAALLWPMTVFGLFVELGLANNGMVLAAIGYAAVVGAGWMVFLRWPKVTHWYKPYRGPR